MKKYWTEPGAPSFAVFAKVGGTKEFWKKVGGGGGSSAGHGRLLTSKAESHHCEFFRLLASCGASQRIESPSKICSGECTRPRSSRRARPTLTRPSRCFPSRFCVQLVTSPPNCLKKARGRSLWLDFSTDSPNTRVNTTRRHKSEITPDGIQQRVPGKDLPLVPREIVEEPEF